MMEEGDSVDLFISLPVIEMNIGWSCSVKRYGGAQLVVKNDLEGNGFCFM